MAKKFTVDTSKMLRQAVQDRAEEVKGKLEVNLPSKSHRLIDSLHIQSTADDSADIMALEYGRRFTKQIEESL